MNLLYSSSSTMLIILAVLYSLLQCVVAEPVTAEIYKNGIWRDSKGCADLQLNFSASSIITDDKMLLFANVNDITNRSEIQFEISVLIGSIDLAKAFTIDQYEIEWRTSPNYTTDAYFLSGDGSRIIFAGQHRTKLNVPTIGSSLITFNPSNWQLDTIEWPAVITESSLPKYALANVNVPELKMTYYSGPEPTTDQAFPNELFAYNYSDGSMSRHAAPSKSWSSASFIPAGAKGMLVMVGGTERADFETPIPMDQIHVYDIATDTWYLQPTTGKAPSSRMNNCAVVASASDGSSHQIHVYGGVRPEDTSFSPLIDNYYILSVPQFVWTKGPILPVPRSSPSCNLLGNHRMVIAAGYVDATCVPLIQIVDINTGNITTSFDSADTSPYVVPDFVVADIDSGSKTPVDGFVTGLDKAWPETYIYASSTETPVPSPTPTPDSKKKTPIGAIVGGTVGGVAVGILALCGILFWRRRRARNQPENTVAAPMASTDPTYPTESYAPTDPKDQYPTNTYPASTYTSAGYPSPAYTAPTSPAPTYTTPAYPGGIEEIGGSDGHVVNQTYELPGHSAKS